MVIIRRKLTRGTVIRAATYAVVIVTLGGLMLWAYFRHRPRNCVVLPPPTKGVERPPMAGLEPRLVFASDRELLAPPCFPWSLASVTRRPRAEVSNFHFTRQGNDKADATLTAAVAEALAQQAPELARPFALEASPPYLVTPATIETAFDLDDDGATASVAVDGAPAELNAGFAEKAAAFTFPGKRGARRLRPP